MYVCLDRSKPETLQMGEGGDIALFFCSKLISDHEGLPNKIYQSF